MGLVGCGFAALARTKGSPDAKRACASRISSRPVRAIKVGAAVDGLRVKGNRTIGAKSIDAASVLTGSAHVAPAPAVVRVGRARSGVRRKNRLNAQSTDAPIGMDMTA